MGTKTTFNRLTHEECVSLLVRLSEALGDVDLCCPDYDAINTIQNILDPYRESDGLEEE